MTNDAIKDWTITFNCRIAHLLFQSHFMLLSSGSSSLFLYRNHQDVCMYFKQVFLSEVCVWSGSSVSCSPSWWPWLSTRFLPNLASSFSLILCLSPHSIPIPSTGSGSLNPRLCPAGLPGDHGVVSSPRDLWGVVCANGHGAGHRLQQCARLRPQHWRRHGSERYHWCKWGWGTPPTSQSHQRLCLLFTSQSQRLRLMFISQLHQSRLAAAVLSVT